MGLFVRVVRTAVIASGILWAAASGQEVAAATLYGVAYAGPDGLSTLYTIDPTTGAAAPVGPIGFQRVSGIDFGSDGRLYGVGERNDGSNTSVLIVIDTATGVGVEIGPTGILGNTSSTTDISIRPSDGTLYAYQDGPDTIVTLNRGTGARTILGPPGPTGGGNGIAYTNGNVLYLADSSGPTTLYTVNQTTGAATPVAPVTYLGFPPLGSPRINAMDVEPSSGVMYASVNDGGGGGGPSYLAKVNTATGDVTHIGPTVPGLDAIAWQPDRCPVRLYGAAKTGGTTAPSTLYSIDPNTGVASPIGPIGFNSVSGVDFHPFTKVLYGVGNRPSDGTKVLITIDPSTGAGTEVGPLVNTTVGGGGLFDVSFRGDGTLFLVAFDLGGNVSIFTVNLATGTATLMGNTFTFAPGNALGHSTGDTFFQTAGSTLYFVHQVTWVSSASAPLTYAGFPGLGAPRINAMDFDPSTGLSFVSVNDGAGGAGPNYLATLDTRTGIVSNIGLSVPGLDALAWLTECSDGDPCTVDECVRCQEVALYGAAYIGPNGLSTLYRINPTSGAAVAIGPIGFERVSGMDFDVLTGLLYATGERADGSNTNVLIIIDPTTGAGTEVGPTGITGFGCQTEPDISFRDSERLYAYLDFCDSVGTLNVLTGASTLLGASGVSGFGNGITYGPVDLLCHADGTNLNFLNPVTGAATFLAPLSYAGFPPPVVGYRVNAMDADCRNRLYAVVQDNGPLNYLAILDFNTGVVTNIGGTVAGMDSIAWRKDHGFCRHTILDSDTDGVPDCVDCAPFDAGSWAVPPEVTGDKFMADKITWFWPSLAPISGPGTTYDLIADALTGLPVGPGGGGESSACGHGSASFAVVATPSPAGTGFWLLVRGHNVCGPGPYGNERRNTVPPFPATPPRVTTTCP